MSMSRSRTKVSVRYRSDSAVILCLDSICFGTRPVAWLTKPLQCICIGLHGTSHRTTVCSQVYLNSVTPLTMLPDMTTSGSWSPVLRFCTIVVCHDKSRLSCADSKWDRSRACRSNMKHNLLEPAKCGISCQI